MEIEFVDYTPTPGEKSLGVATINYGPILLRFRINAGKDGHGFYPSPLAHKVGDKYVNSFEIDSSREYTKILEVVRENVQRAMNPSKSARIPLTENTFDEVPF